MGSSGHVLKESTAFRRSLAKAEAKIRYSDVEHLVVLDKDGNVLFSKDGEETQIALTRAEERLLRGADASHNHPGGTTFSPDDVETLVELDMHSLRAVGSDGSSYTLTKVFKPFANRKAFYTDFKAKHKEHVRANRTEYNKVKRAYEDDRITEKQFRAEVEKIYHKISKSNSRWLRENAERYGYEYKATMKKERRAH